MTTSDRFQFRKTDRIGAAAAEEDQHVLSRCFVDTGLLDPLGDFTDSRRLVIGRTGIGKSALLARLCESHRHSIRLMPSNLAFEHIYSTVRLDDFVGAGIKPDLFFKLLWRHVICIELLKARFPSQQGQFLGPVLETIKNKLTRAGTLDVKFTRALEYLKRYEHVFWSGPEDRIRELTNEVASSLQAGIKVGVSGIASFEIGGSKSSSGRPSNERKPSAPVRPPVEGDQLRRLGDIADLIDALMENDGVSYLIIIDGLDENWVDSEYKYRLVRALIDTTRDFFRLKTVKVVIALRDDLLERTLEETKSIAFQTEKFEDLMLRVKWTQNELLDMLNRRVQELVKSRYTKRPVRAEEVLPESIDDIPGAEYIIERSLMRPRDVIDFFNSAISRAVDQPRISSEMLRAAEADYSRGRREAVCEEWAGVYSYLDQCMGVLEGCSRVLRVGDLKGPKLEELALSLTDSTDDAMKRLALGFVEDSANVLPFQREIARVLYHCGIVGVKVHAVEPVWWRHLGSPAVDQRRLEPDTALSVHPVFWRTLGCRPFASDK